MSMLSKGPERGLEGRDLNLSEPSSPVSAVSFSQSTPWLELRAAQSQPSNCSSTACSSRRKADTSPAGVPLAFMIKATSTAGLAM
jgi:hypothetical protein